MFVQERYAAILKHMAQHPRFPIEELQEAMDVSRSTLRRDLLELEEQGKLVRVHGGVMSSVHLHGEPTFSRRSGERIKAKRRAAAIAAEFASTNASVFIDAGTTCLEVGKTLMHRTDLTLYTNSVPLLVAACEAGAKAQVLSVGGELRVVTGALAGGLADGWLGRLRFDLAFIAASGLDANEGASTTEVSEAAVKNSLLHRAKQRVLVADLGKCDQPAAVTFSSWEDFDVWVTDALPAPKYRRVIKDLRYPH